MRCNSGASNGRQSEGGAREHHGGGLFVFMFQSNESSDGSEREKIWRNLICGRGKKPADC